MHVRQDRRSTSPNRGKKKTARWEVAQASWRGSVLQALAKASQWNLEMLANTVFPKHTNAEYRFKTLTDLGLNTDISVANTNPQNIIVVPLPIARAIEGHISTHLASLYKTETLQDLAIQFNIPAMTLRQLFQRNGVKFKSRKEAYRAFHQDGRGVKSVKIRHSALKWYLTQREKEKLKDTDLAKELGIPLKALVTIRAWTDQPVSSKNPLSHLLPIKLKVIKHLISLNFPKMNGHELAKTFDWEVQTFFNYLDRLGIGRAATKNTQPTGIQFPCSQHFRDKVLTWFITTKGTSIPDAQLALLIGVEPDWLQNQLERLKLRPINPIQRKLYSRQDNEVNSLAVVRAILAQEYLKEEKSSIAIANMIQASSTRVVEYIRKAGLKARTHQEAVVLAGIKRRIDDNGISVYLRKASSLVFESGDERFTDTKENRPDEAAERREETSKISAQIDRLAVSHPVHNRIIKYLFFLEQSHAQIASIEGITEEEVLKLRDEALDYLRREF